jgi:hypothetical protein
MPAGSQHHQHFCDERMAHDVGLGQRHHGNVRDRAEPAGDFGEPGEPVEEVAPVAGCRSGRGTRAARLSAVRWSQRCELDVDLP